LATALEPLVQSTKRYDLCLEAFEWGAKAARRLNRTGWESVCARFLSLQARICTFRHGFDRALALLTEATTLAGNDSLVQASIAEFTGRYHEVQGDWELDLPKRMTFYADGEAQLIRAVAIDRALMANSTDEDDRRNALRGLGIHLRMLANVRAKLGKAREAQESLAELAPYLTDDRNRSRVRAVWAKVYVVLRDPARAQTELDEARRLVEQSGSALSYVEELKDIEAEIRKVQGRIEDARAIWGELVRQALAVHHPKSEIFQAKLNELPLPVLR
jgi:tetratricopeptide (TPR) repeat protein